MKKFCTVLLMTLMTFCVCNAADDKKSSDGFEPAGQAGNMVAAPAADAKAPAAADAKVAGDAKGVAASQPAEEKNKSIFDNSFIFILLGVMVLMIFMSSRSRKKQEQKRRELIDSLKKGDKVVTIGGICGTIVEAKPTEIVVKVDDNTKIKFARWAVRNAGEEVADEKKKDTDDQQNCDKNNA